MSTTQTHQTIEQPEKRNTQGIPIGIEDIRKAALILNGERDFLPGRREQIALHTPLVFSDALSRQVGCTVWLKLENLQKTGSYKIRGAFNNIANLTPERREHGLVTASAGNHAQGVAAAASLFGIESLTTIFVPIGTPKVKQDNTRAFGVEVREIGENFDQAREAAYAEAETSNRTFIEPFDDWHTIAGQGTICLQIAVDLPHADAIIAPVGGGGLISGIAIAARAVLPDALVIGAQAAGSPSMILSLDQGEATTLPYPPVTQIADGIKVSRPGDRPFQVCNALLGSGRFVAVPDIETVGAAADLMVYAKVIAEGAGAIGVAALRNIQASRIASLPPFGSEQHVVVVVSGGNIDPSFSWRILYEQTVPNLLTLRVAMPDRPGELLRMLGPIARGNVNIIDVDVNRLDARPRMGERIVEVCVAISGQTQAETLIGSLNATGYNVLVSRWQDPSVDRAGNMLPSHYVPTRNARTNFRSPEQVLPHRHNEVDLRVEGFRLTDRFGRVRHGNQFLPEESIFVELALRNSGTIAGPAGLVTQIYSDSPNEPLVGSVDVPEFALLHGDYLVTKRPFLYGSWPSGPREHKFVGSVRSFSRSAEGTYTARVWFDALGRTGGTPDATQATVEYTITASAIAADPPTLDPSQEPLLLVNKKRPLPQDYSPSGMRVPQVAREKEFLLKGEAAGALESMFADAAGAGVRLRMISGFRTFERQRVLYDGLCTQRGVPAAELVIARPGHSEHQTGFAVDIGDLDAVHADVSLAFASTGAGGWLVDHAARFGFILRYPQNRTPITGFSWEPWHFRFVGVSVALYLEAERLTLEEFMGVEGGEYPTMPAIAGFVNSERENAPAGSKDTIQGLSDV